MHPDVTRAEALLLTELVTGDIRASYRASIRRRRDDRVLDGMEKASSRGELTSGDETETDDADAGEPARP